MKRILAHALPAGLLLAALLLGSGAASAAGPSLPAAASSLPAVEALSPVQLDAAPAAGVGDGVRPVTGLDVRGRRFVETLPGVWVAVRPARGSQQARYARLSATWSADQLAVAREQGFPVFRLRDLTAGVLTEIWTYPGTGLVFVFDARGRLVDRKLW